MSTMEDTKMDAINAAPTQIHHEVAPGEKMPNEASLQESLIGTEREPYGPGGMYYLSDVAASSTSAIEKS
jgi:hypothetical protein